MDPLIQHRCVRTHWDSLLRLNDTNVTFLRHSSDRYSVFIAAMSAATYRRVDEPVDDLSDADSEHDHQSSRMQARTSEDVRRRDHETLTAEEEAERFLSNDGREEKRSRIRHLFRRDDEKVTESKRQRRKESKRKRRRKKNKGEESELMYEMEEGGPRSSSAESSGHSSEVDMRQLKEVQARQKVWR